LLNLFQLPELTPPTKLYLRVLAETIRQVYRVPINAGARCHIYGL
jgi:hypothetical protein